MKNLLLATLALTSTAAFAQSLSLQSYSALLGQKQATLEKVHPGMSKKLTTTSSFVTDSGAKCDFAQISTQSVLKLEGDKMIVLSVEEYKPVASAACTEAQQEPFTEKVIFYEKKPLLADDLADLQASAADIKAITRTGELVTMLVNATNTNPDGSTSTEQVTVKYDLTKPSFKYLVATEAKDYKIVTTDMADIDLSKVDLKQVVFCASNSPDEQDCVEGDFSDILF